MKKRFVALTLSLFMATATIIGCGKSDEQKARDEIMSHMDADEKAAIAEDQKAMAEYEAEKEAKENEEPIDYSENMVEKSLVEIIHSVNTGIIDNNYVNVPDINILLPDDEYITGSDATHISYGNTFAVRASAVSVDKMNGDIEVCGNYNVSMHTMSVAAYLYIAEIGAENALKIEVEGLPAVIEKNYDYVKEQLSQ